MALTALLAIPAAAQEQPEPSLYDRALAAGYKAQFICSGLFNGGKMLEDITADELTGIYDRIADIVPTLEARIDNERKIVSVVFADDTPPRHAAWSSDYGCRAAPIGGMDNAIAPAINKRPILDEMPWPMGDAGAEIMRTTEIKPIDRIVGSAFQEGDNAFGEKRFGGKTSAVLIVQNDQIIWEAYKPGHDKHTGQRTWSVAKSIAGTLVGHAVYNGGVSVNEPLGITQWSDSADPRQKITLDNVLRMASGLQSDTAGNRTDAIYMGGAAVSERAPNWPLLRVPGSHFRYANNDTLLAILGVKQQSQAFSPVSLFDKIGMTRTFAETDWKGDYILSSQVWTTSRDLARLGILYLHDGIWPYGKSGAKRLLPEGWRDYVSAPSGPQPAGSFGYGATFWLMNKSKGIPKDTIAAFGNRGQYLVIIPSRDLIIVRRGYDTPSDRFDIEEFTQELLSSMT